jgi:hypothetical protein
MLINQNRTFAFMDEVKRSEGTGVLGAKEKLNL